MQKLDLKIIQDLIKRALDEDLGCEGDITSNFTIPATKLIKFQIASREEIILCGADIVIMVFVEVAKRFKSKNKLIINKKFSDGEKVKKNKVILEGLWNAKGVFAAERVALNLIQHLSGIATITAKYVAAVKGNKTRILDTRKTIPGLRMLQKYAVTVGGGQNHRIGLYDGILIKDNHIAAAGGIKEAVNMVKKNLNSKMKIEVECDNLAQVKESLKAKVDIIMLDNMNLSQIKQAFRIIDGKAKIEVSGGITLKNISAISKIGVDYISVGALTHSVKAADIGLDIISN